MTKTDIRGIAFTALAVVVAGLLLHYGRNLPVVKDARDGFGG